MVKPKFKYCFGLSLLWLFLAAFAEAQCPFPTLTPVTWGDGSGSFSPGASALTLTGTGTFSPGQTSDNGEAAYVTMTGNGQILAQLESVTGFLGANTMAGIFVRGGTGAGGDGGLLVNQGPVSANIQFLGRANSGPLTPMGSMNVPAPGWIRIQNSGSILYPSASTDGANWTPMPTPYYDLSQDSSFAGNTLIYGLLVWNEANGSPTTAVFGNVCAGALTNFTPIPTSTITSTRTATAIFTATPSPSATGSPTPSFSSTFTPTRTTTATFTPPLTPSATASQTPTVSLTSTGTASLTATPSASPRATSTATPSPSATVSPTPSLSPTFTPTRTATAASTPTDSTTASPTHAATSTATPSPLATDSPTATPPPGFRVWPNPFTPQLPPNNSAHFLLPPGHGAGELVIADLRRRKIRTYSFSPGADVQWDGLDDGGKVVSSGVYLYLLESDGTVRRGTVTVMR